MAGENVVHEGFLWIVGAHEDPRKPECWARRKIWLTSAGGLFYNSEKDLKPCARQVCGLRLNVVDHLAERFAFEVVLPGAALSPIFLAAETLEDRDVWMRHLQAFRDGTPTSPSATASSKLDVPLSPLDVFQGHNKRGSRRMSFSNVGDGAAIPGTGSSPLMQYSSSANSAPKSPNAASSSPSSLKLPNPMGREVRRNSQYAFAEKTNTMLVLDWDDTIFPTTWVRSDCRMNWKLPLEQQLEPGPRKNLIQSLLAKHYERVVEFLEDASVHATVFIVTLARRPWVEISMANFMPGLVRLIESQGLKILYAQEYLGGATQAYMKDEFMSNDEALRFWSKVKGECIGKELEELHEKYGISWKNIISFGDSDFERFGTIAACEDHIRKEMEGGTVISTGATAEGISKDGHLKKLRTKTLKMLNEPTVEELTAELSLLKMWLPHMVKKDSGFDLELESSEDNDRLMQLHKVITGEEKDLSWMILAGMPD